MKIILISALLILVSCGKKNNVKQVIPHYDDMDEFFSSGKRWSKNKFPLKIMVPCIKDTDDGLYAIINCNDQIDEERSNYVMYPVEASGNKVIDSLVEAVETWNNALGRTVFELEVAGRNVAYNNTPVTYLTESESAFKRIAFLSQWFSAMSEGDRNKPGDDVLAVTIYSYSQDNNRLIDADILFNLKKFSFITEPKQQDYSSYCSASYGSSNPAGCSNDIRCSWNGSSCRVNPDYSGNIHFKSVLVHELGHFLGMEHVAPVTDPNSIMNPSLGSEVVKVSLSKGDVCRINQRYRDVFANCSLETAETKFCYDVTNVDSVGVDPVSGECLIQACKEGYKQNTEKTACIVK